MPPALHDGQSIRLRGQGGAGLGQGEPGDLFLRVRFIPHPDFTVDGRDVHSRIELMPWEAVLGTSKPIETLGGTVALKVPPKTHSGQRLRLKDRGLPGGHHYVAVTVDIPAEISPEAEALYRSLRDEEQADV